MILWHAITAAITCALFVAAALAWAGRKPRRKGPEFDERHFSALLRELRADPERPWRRR